jgi:molybdate transport system ATP-binding protein
MTDPAQPAMNPAPVWEVRVAKRLHHAGHAFQLDIAFQSPAHRVVLVGPSGAGKTQTLRMVAGITAPDRGRIVVAGRTLLDSDAGIQRSPQQRAIGYMFQDYALFPHLTVRQNIAFARSPALVNPRRSARDPMVEHWIETLRLQPIADHLPSQISGGQRQRTALARALAREPVALLLDEPFAALDRSLRVRLRQELLDVQMAVGLPLLLITHDDDDVRMLAEDVVRIHDGKLLPRRPGDNAP